MALDTYANLQAAIASWTNRSDLTTPIPDFITQAEATLNKVLRSRHMIINANVTVLLNTDRIAVPEDLLDVAYVVNNAVATETLVKKPFDWLAQQQRLRLKTAGIPLYFAIIGQEILVCPVPAASKTYKLSYYQSIPALSGGNPTNWLLEHHPDLYLYTSLMHAYPFLADEDRATVMGNQMVQMVQALLKMNETTTLEGAEVDVNKG